MTDLTVRRAGKPDLPAVLALYGELNSGRVATLEQAEKVGMGSREYVLKKV